MSDFDRQRNSYSPSEPWATRGGSAAHPLTAAEVSVGERIAFIRKVYALFFVATLFAIGGALLGLAFPPLMIASAQHPIISFILLIGGVMGAQAVRHVPGVNLAALFGFTTFTGVIISPVLYVIGSSNPGSILQAGVMTVVIFGGLTAYVFISARDFSFLRGMVTVGLLVVIGAGLTNIFVGSLGLGFAISAAALLLFAGFVLYDTSNIIRRYPTNEYVAGALSLYLDAFNIFLALLRLLNRR
jgi:modulator of FtsH protease